MEGEPVEPKTPEPAVDSEILEKDEEQFNFEKTIEVENSSLKSPSNESVEVDSVLETNAENGKKRTKEEKPPSKIVVRRLPPSMTKEQFLEQVSPLPEIDHMYYVQGNPNESVNPFSRAYLNFVNQEDLYSFSNTFDNYVFLDSKGQEYPAIVEFNIVQRFPKPRPKKKDPLMGTIESDPIWITFQEDLLAEALDSKTQSGKATKQHYFETEISTTEEVRTTPLLEFLKTRRADKARHREERREEKKRKETERKLKQQQQRSNSGKEKKGEGDQEEEAAGREVKVIAARDRREHREKERLKKKEEKEKMRETRAREFKSRGGGKSYQEERLKLAERREEKRREQNPAQSDKTTDNPDTPSENTEPNLTTSLQDAKSPDDKSTIKTDRKKYERKPRNDIDDYKEEKRRLRNERNNYKRENRKEEYSRRNSERRNSESDFRRKAKGYKSTEDIRSDKVKPDNSEVTKTVSVEPHEQDVKCDKDATKPLVEKETTVISNVDVVNSSKDQLKSSNHERSDKVPSDSSPRTEEKLKSNPEDMKKSEEDVSSPEGRSRKERSTEDAPKTSSSSRDKDRPDEKAEEKSETPGKTESTPETESKKTEGTQRRIRNKDRPSIEIYRPGMGKFSKQRLEKERAALGSSTEVESPSHSPSPQPKSKLIS